MSVRSLRKLDCSDVSTTWRISVLSSVIRLEEQYESELSGEIKWGQNSSFERVEDFKYLGTTLTNQDYIQKEIKSRLKLGNACCHSVRNILSSILLSKNLKIKIYRTIILPVVLYGCETWSLTLREEHRLRVLENRVLW